MKADGCDGDHGGAGERAPGDTEGRFNHDREHRRLHAVEDGVDQREVGVVHVEDTQGQHHECAGQDEEEACGEASLHAVHQPADVGCQLLRFGAGQEHAVVQRVEESRIADPLPLINQKLVHQRDLSRRAAEIYAAEIGPESNGLGKRRQFH